MQRIATGTNLRSSCGDGHHRFRGWHNGKECRKQRPPIHLTLTKTAPASDHSMILSCKYLTESRAEVSMRGLQLGRDQSRVRKPYIPINKKVNCNAESRGSSPVEGRNRTIAKGADGRFVLTARKPQKKNRFFGTLRALSSRRLGRTGVDGMLCFRQKVTQLSFSRSLADLLLCGFGHEQ
jgi:hypothetical protein